MTPATEPERILVVGAGGFGREVVHWARAAWPELSGRIAGFLAVDGGGRPVNELPLPILADPATFEPRPGDGLVLAIGIPGVRRRVAETLAARGGAFLTLVHPTAVVAATAVLGPGSVVCPYAIVSDAAVLGRCVLVNYHASLAHDAAADDFAVLSPYATLGGGARVAADVFLGLHATVGPGVSVGAGSKVAANSCALHDVPPRSLVHGVPGKVGPLL
jgi:sugar O-acyltransferase (sialic acid O-acetyltransferase NeuD family)